MKSLSTVTLIVGLALGASLAAPVFAQTLPPHTEAPHSEHSLAQQAEILGITQSDLRSRLDAGKTFSQIQRDLGLNAQRMGQNTLHQHQGQLKEQLDALVADGKMSQAKEMEILSRAHHTSVPRVSRAHHGKGKRK